MTAELPQMRSHAYASSAVNLEDQLRGLMQPRRIGVPTTWAGAVEQIATVPKVKAQPKEKVEMADDTRRLVQIFIADSNPNIPLDKALIYQGEQILTELSDQELFFEIPVAEMLKKHNEYRVTLVDKSVKDKTIHLEPARIRDLKMVVVTVASF